MRVSATTLESYRLYMEKDFMSEGELVATIRGEFRPTEKMLLGLAFGRALEKPQRWMVPGGYEVFVKNESNEWQKFFFSDADMAPALEKYDRRGVCEAKGTRNYGGMEVVAKVDHILGTVIDESKTRVGQFDFDKYQESCQWRFMLDIFGASKVHYNVFMLDDKACEDEPLVKSIEEFDVYPYPAMHDDCCGLLAGFLGFVSARNLESHLHEKVYA